MNESIKVIVLCISILYSTTYLRYIEHTYPKLKSISMGAKYLTDKGMVILFMIFMLVVSGSFVVILYDQVSAWIAVFMCLISVYTGYNPNIKNKKLEKVLHIVFITTAIIAAMVYFVVISFWLIIPVGLYGLYALIMIFRKDKRKIYKIEIGGIIIGWLCELILI